MSRAIFGSARSIRFRSRTARRPSNGRFPRWRNCFAAMQSRPMTSITIRPIISRISFLLKSTSWPCAMPAKTELIRKWKMSIRHSGGGLMAEVWARFMILCGRSRRCCSTATQSAPPNTTLFLAPWSAPRANGPCGPSRAIMSPICAKHFPKKPYCYWYFIIRTVAAMEARKSQ